MHPPKIYPPSKSLSRCLTIAAILLTALAANAQTNPIPAPTPGASRTPQPGASAAYHPWNWEIGIRSTDLTAYYQAAANNYNYYNDDGPSMGVEVFASQRYPNHTFSRLALGMGSTNRNIPGDINGLLDNISGGINTIRASALTAEAAYGIEFPQSQKPFIDRFRLRAGISLALQTMQQQVLRRSVYHVDGAYAFLHDRSSGGSMFRGTIFFQTQFRIASQVFIGLEWRFGPSLFLNNHLTHFERVIADGINGYHYLRDDTVHSGATFRFSNPIGIPVFILGLSL